MNYYIIPKNNFNIKIDFKLTNERISPFISYSLIFYLNNIYNQVVRLNSEYHGGEDLSIDFVNKIVNPFEFIHTNVPGSIISVSKVKPDSNIFFELMEVFQLFNVNEILSLKHKINIAHLTNNHSSTNYLLNMLREENDDTIICKDFNYSELFDCFVEKPCLNPLDLIICEFPANEYINTHKYIHNILLVFLIIIKCQANQGTCIIKLDNLFYKAIVDILFILSGLYDKIYLIKPSISNVTKGERYIVCKSFSVLNLEQSNLVHSIETSIIPRLNANLISRSVETVISNEIPYFFLNKLEESNAVIGQQQLEAYDQIIYIFKNKNRDEKIEILKRNHIQKCIQWCEKNQLPHNKFVDKVNMFLTPKKKEVEE